MKNKSVNLRFWLIICMTGATYVYVHFLSTIHVEPLVQDLSLFPTTLGNFTMVNDKTFDDAIIQNAGMDSYLMRQYRDGSGYTVGLYIGYYQAQTEGHIIHSPKHCLPGSGWNTVKTAIHQVEIPENKPSSVRINQWLMQKGGDKQLVHFWYQGRGRIVASEYLDRFLMIFDSFIKKRSDGALIRIIGPGDHLKRDIKKQDALIIALLKTIDDYIPN